jgi:hypothetical protein
MRKRSPDKKQFQHRGRAGRNLLVLLTGKTFLYTIGLANSDQTDVVLGQNAQIIDGALHMVVRARETNERQIRTWAAGTWTVLFIDPMPTEEAVVSE